MRRQCGRGAKGIETLPGGHSDSKTIEPRCIVSDDLALVDIGNIEQPSEPTGLLSDDASSEGIQSQNTPRTGSRSVFGRPWPR
jgi:hypothetical protein